MEVTKNQIDDLNLQVTLEIAAEDYAAIEKKKLNERLRNTELKGFRKGKAPMSLIKKLYGEQILVECVNSVINEQLDKVVKEDNLHVLGEPLASEDQPENEWTAGNDFTFKFDIAETPELGFEVSKADEIPYYSINVTKAAKDAMKKNLLSQAGSLEEAEKSDAEGYIIADISNGEVTADGVYVSIRNVAEDVRPSFVGLKADDKVTVNVNEAFTNETDRAAMLRIKKEELAGINPEFTFTVVNVKQFVPAKEGQEAYDRIYGEGVVKTPEEFEAKIEEQIRSNHSQEADYRFAKDAREYFLNKADVKLPEKFLRRWLISVNEGKFTPEQVDAEFEGFLADFRWQMVRGKIMQQFSLKVSEEDIRAAAESYVAYQYAMYGMPNPPQDIITEAAKSVLSDENQVRRMEENVEENKTIAAIRENVTLVTKKISEDKFRELK